MDQLILDIAARLGISPLTLPIYIGIIVLLANLAGKSIPASATGPLGVLRKVLLVIGAYVPQRITPAVTTKTVSKAIASEVSDDVLKAAAANLPDSIESGASAGLVSTSLIAGAAITPSAQKKRAASTRVSSHWIAGLLTLILAFFLVGCTTAQTTKVESALNTVCTSAPIAQSLYNVAVSSGDQNRVNDVLNYIQLACPAMLILVQTVPVRVEVPPPPPLPAPGPERG